MPLINALVTKVIFKLLLLDDNQLGRYVPFMATSKFVKQ